MNIELEKILKEQASTINKRGGYETKEINLESGLIDGLGFDSLDTVEVMLDIEDKFDIEVIDADAAKWKTVGDINSYVKNKIKEKQEDDEDNDDVGYF